MRKSINSATQKFEDQITEELVLDAVPTVNSFNGVTSDGVARAIAGASGEVPQVTESDNGKVLKAIYDEGGPAVEWGEGVTVDQTYDATSTNAQSGTAVAGAIAGVNQVPASTSGDSGKVLTVNSQGAAEWNTPAAPSGGDSDEWWGGDPGRVSMPGYGELKILFKDATYDPRNDSDTSFLNRFSAITKNDDGSYTFTFKKPTSGTNYAYAAFNGKYTGDNEFVILAWETEFEGNYGSWAYIFDGCTGLRAVYNATDAGYTKAYDCTRAFYGCTGLTTFSMRDRGNCSFVRIGASMFEGCTSLKHAVMGVGVLVSNGNNRGTYTSMFNGCSALEDGPWMFGQPSSCSQMFAGCRSLRGFNSLHGKYDFFGTASQVAYECDCSSMFSACYSLENISPLMPVFRSIYISSAYGMFGYCTSLKDIRVPLTLRSSGAYCNAMFENCQSLVAPPECLDYSLVTNATAMFKGCICLYNVTPLASVTWNSSLTNVSDMFNNCYTLQKGLKDVYDNMAATATITSHDYTFGQCGRVYSNPERAQIPSSWGGTGA